MRIYVGDVTQRGASYFARIDPILYVSSGSRPIELWHCEVLVISCVNGCMRSQTSHRPGTEWMLLGPGIVSSINLIESADKHTSVQDALRSLRLL